MQLLSGKRDSNNLFVVFITVVLVNTETVTSFINYSDERHDEQPLGVDSGEARTTRQILESSDNWGTYRSRYSLQEATEHLLQYGALLRNQILDTFGALVYDHYDDYSIAQTEALYRVYHETLERKYNIFNIVPSVLANPDTKPTKICRHIYRHVRTCLKESSQLCTTIRKHDFPHPDTASTPAVNVTRHVFKSARLKKYYPRGFSLPAVLQYLKAGILRLNVGLLSGLLHNVQYDSFDDEVRTAERNVMAILRSEVKGGDEHRTLVRRNQIQRANSVSELLKKFFESRRTIYDGRKGKNFAVLAEHVVREVEAISQNIELFGSVYENDTIHMRFLFNLILPPDVVDSDITEAKDYLLEKIEDYDIVGKYLKVEKYQQSGPDQLLMEILGQMRDINFAVDIATALRTHARFWHQSHMVNNLNELLELFDAYENLRKVKKFSHLMSLMDEVRYNLWDSKNVSIEILCNNPRACLRLGLETVARCLLINPKTKQLLHKLFYHLSQDGSIYADNCRLPVSETRTDDVPETTRSPITLTEALTYDLFTRKRLDATEASTAETTTPKPTERSAPTIDDETSTSEPTTTTARPELELPRAVYTMPEDTMVKATTSVQSELREHSTVASTAEEIATTMTTIESTTIPHSMRETVAETMPPKLTTEQATSMILERTQESTTERLTTTSGTSLFREGRITTGETTVEPTMEEKVEVIQPTSTPEESTTKLPAVVIGRHAVKELITRDETTPPTDDGCYGDNCGLEPPNEETNTQVHRAWITNSTDPPFLLENLRIEESTDLPTVVVVTTTTTTTTTPTETPTAREIVTDIPETSSESTTAADELPTLLKKPKTYSVSSSGEDCSGESCTSSECSGEGCPSFSSSDKTISNECNDRDGGCSPETSEDERDCSNEGCVSTTVPSEEIEECIGDGCVLQPTAPSFSECVGEDCAKDSTLSTSTSNCLNEDCSESSRSNESNCSGTECVDNNQEHPTTVKHINEIFHPTTSLPWIKCDNKDPHHQRRLHRLAKVRMMNALHATVPIPTIHPALNDENDIPTESHSKTVQDSINPKTGLKPSRQDFHPLENLQQKETPVYPNWPGHVAWFPLAPNSIPTKEIENHQFPDESDETYGEYGEDEEDEEKDEEEEDIPDSEMEPNYAANTNMNFNTNFINLRRYLTGNHKTGSETLPPVFQVSPPSRGYRRVVAKVPNRPVLTRRINESPRHESHAILNEGIKPTEINSEAHKRRRTGLTRLNPILYQRRSEDEFGVVRKNRSIIRAPQRASRRYRAL